MTLDRQRQFRAGKSLAVIRDEDAHEPPTVDFDLD